VSFNLLYLPSMLHSDTDKLSTDVQDDYDLPALPVPPVDNAESPKKINRATAATQKAGARAIGLDSDTDTEVSWVKSSPHGFKKMTSAESRCVICEYIIWLLRTKLISVLY
jgi:hypothetical protein